MAGQRRAWRPGKEKPPARTHTMLSFPPGRLIALGDIVDESPPPCKQRSDSMQYALSGWHARSLARLLAADSTSAACNHGGAHTGRAQIEGTGGVALARQRAGASTPIGDPFAAAAEGTTR